MPSVTRTLAILVAFLLPLSALAADGGSSSTDAKVKVGDGEVTLADGGAAATKKPPAPKDVKEAIEVGRDAIAAAKGGKWWLFSALVVTVLLFLLKLLGTKVGSWWGKLGRWRYIIPPVLSLAAALLAAFQGGVSVDAAVGVFTASWATSSLQELWEHGILNKPRKGPA